jgi:hypothetical protein
MWLLSKKRLNLYVYFIKSFSLLNIVACMSDYLRGFGLVTGFVDHLYTQPVTTRDYNSFSGSHTLQITVAATRMSSLHWLPYN